MILLFDIAFGGWDNDFAESKALLHALYLVLRLSEMAFRGRRRQALIEESWDLGPPISSAILQFPDSHVYLTILIKEMVDF